MKPILVVAEHRLGVLAEGTLEALGAALALAGSAQAEVVAVLLADDPEPLAAPLLGRAPALRLLAHPALREYNPEPYLAALEPVIRSLQPGLILMGHTSQGLDLAPALAGRQSLPLLTDVVGLSWGAEAEPGTGSLAVRRLIYGGKIEERLTLKPAPLAVLTLRSGAFAPAGAGAVESRAERILLTDLAGRHDRRFLEYLRAAVGDVDITAAEILVAVGRGLGSADNLPLVQELAEAMGATLACSRPVADLGWLSKSRQVGTSGQTVRPKVYLALGISGAFQHQAGMRRSETIIAVNKDPRAPIFQVAHYGVVEDLFRVVPLLIAQFKK